MRLFDRLVSLLGSLLGWRLPLGAPTRGLALLLVLGLVPGLGCTPATGRAFADLEYPAPVADVRTVQVGATTVAYTEHGTGTDTVLLVHGLGSYQPVWIHNLPALARGRRVVAIDLPGYGKSSKSDDYAYSMEFFAGVVQGVIEQLSLGHPVLVGHSMGGQIALTHALRYPGQARALVLTSPAGLETFEDGEAKWMADSVDADFTCKATPEAIYTRHVGNFHHMPRDAQFMVEHRVAVIGGPDFRPYCEAVSRSVRAMLDEPVYERLPEVDVPTLVLFGKYDALIPNPFLHGGSTERLAERTVKQLPQAELVMLPRAGHMAQFEQASAWNDAVVRFLNGLPPPPTEPPPPAEPPPADEPPPQPEPDEETDPDAIPPNEAGTDDADEPDATDPDADESDAADPDAVVPDATDPDAALDDAAGETAGAGAHR